MPFYWCSFCVNIKTSLLNQYSSYTKFFASSSFLNAIIIITSLNHNGLFRVISQAIDSATGCQERWQGLWVRPCGGCGPRCRCGHSLLSLSDTPLPFCSCTDGLYSFIHKCYGNFDLALDVQHVSDWGGGSWWVVGKEQRGGTRAVELVLLARHTNCSVCLLLAPQFLCSCCALNYAWLS